MTSTREMKDKAENVRLKDIEEGDFLTGLDNGYVVDVDSAANVSLGLWSAAPYDYLKITFHDAEGEEQYLIGAPNTRLSAFREGGFDLNEED